LSPTGQVNCRLILKGLGVLKDYKQASYWQKKSAKQGYPNAQLYLGMMYHFGRGVPKDASKSKYWIKKAFESSYPLTSQMALKFWNENLAD
jgi:TPR repeat protein